MEFLLDGVSLTPETVYFIGMHPECTVGLTDDAWTLIRRSRDVVDRVLERREIAYGINTGFGNFSNVIIPDESLAQLQVNLIRSHAAGVGEPILPHQTRMLMVLRANVFAKGHSGIRTETVEKLLAALNKNCLPLIPCQGTVGASGDLAPLSHLALGLLGEGKMRDPLDGQWKPAATVLHANGLLPIELRAKEGLALINGTQFMAALGAEAVTRAISIGRQADVIAALTLDALHGSSRPFHPAIHQARPHKGQQLCASRLRVLLNFGGPASEIMRSHVNCGRVQDSYTLRCVPQIHGIAHDTLDFVCQTLTVECNSATDNPMIFPDLPAVFPGWEDEDANDDDPSLGIIISGGNFHGEYPAKVLDFLAIACHEYANVSERRIERLVNPMLSKLPAFLVNQGGLNSGYMIAHCTAASLVSENKVLCHPSSVDSISTSAAQEDHVSMGGMAARKALAVVSNVEHVLAIELLAAVQAIDMSAPLKTSSPLEAVCKLVREVVPTWEHDRFMAPDIEAITVLLRTGKVWETVSPWLES